MLNAENFIGKIVEIIEEIFKAGLDLDFTDYATQVISGITVLIIAWVAGIITIYAKKIVTLEQIKKIMITTGIVFAVVALVFIVAVIAFKLGEVRSTALVPPSTPAPTVSTMPTPASPETPTPNDGFLGPFPYEELDETYNIILYWNSYTKRDENGTFQVINKFTDENRSIFHSLYEAYSVNNELNDSTGQAKGIWPSQMHNLENDYAKEYDFYIGNFINSERSIDEGEQTTYRGIILPSSVDGMIRYNDIKGVENTGYAQ